MVVIRYSIQRMVGKLKKISSTSNWTKVEEQRQRLVKQIETYHTKIDTILAGVDVGDAWINHVGWDQEIGEDEDAEEETVPAERMSLFLPSYLSEADRQRVGLNEVAKQELELRKGQANDCLEAIRTTLGQKAVLMRTKVSV